MPGPLELLAVRGGAMGRLMMLVPKPDGFASRLWYACTVVLHTSGNLSRDALLGFLVSSGRRVRLEQFKRAPVAASWSLRSSFTICSRSMLSADFVSILPTIYSQQLQLPPPSPIPPCLSRTPSRRPQSCARHSSDHREFREYGLRR